MHRNRITIVASVLAVCLLAGTSAFAGDDTKGMIISRTGETLIVSSQGEKVTVVLTDDTKVQDRKGLFGLDKVQFSATVLIPGLKVKVDGSPDDQGRIVAKSITFDGDDLETAQMIEAGLHPTAQQVYANQQNISANQQNIAGNKQNIAANRQDISSNQQNIAANRQQVEQNLRDIEENTQRFSQLSEYDVKDGATVNFAVGSSRVSEEDKAELLKMARQANDLTGYIIEVRGFADSTGSAMSNTKLSQDRAKAVIACLVQDGGVPVRHVVAPGAMGESNAAASNETRAGRAENRRVEVKVLLNKGIAGK